VWLGQTTLLAFFLGLPPVLLQAQEEEERDLVVRGLSFSGNKAIDDYTLQVSIATSNSSFFARAPVIRWLGLGSKRYFNESEFRRDVLRIQTLYRASGYPGVRVDTTVRRSDESVSLNFRIFEGEPIRIVAIAIQGGEDIVSQRQLLERIPLRAGDPFNRLLIQASADTIRVALRNRGYPFVEIFRNFDEDRGNRTAEVRFDVDAGPPATVEAVEVVGNRDLSDKVIRRAATVREGQLFSQRAMNQSQLDLYRMGLFNYVNISLKDSLPESLDDTLVTVQVQVSEGALRRIRLSAGYGTIDCLRTRGSWTLNNFMGDAQTLELSAGVSRMGAGDPLTAGFENNVCPGLRDEDERFLKLNYQIAATFREPFFIDRRTSAAVSVSAERVTEFKAYLREAYGGRLSLTRRIPGRVPVTMAYEAFIDRTDADPATFCTFLDVCDVGGADKFTDFRLTSAVVFDVVRDRTDSPLDATRGSRVRFDVRHASKAIGSNEFRQFTRGVVDLESHYRVGRGGVFSWRIRLGGVTSPRIDIGGGAEERFVPPGERFYAGGANSVRGFSQNELGPFVRVIEIDRGNSLVEVPNAEGGIDSLVGRLRTSPSGGEALLLANVEYRFLLSRRLSGALFVDAGQVFERDREEGGSDLRITPGAGLRLASPIGPIRLDIGFNPYPPLSGLLYKLEPEGTELEVVKDAAGNDFQFTPDRGFLGRFRLHFSVGQAF
jgi:outer membrane protein assembly factor BamA